MQDVPVLAQINWNIGEGTGGEGRGGRRGEEKIIKKRKEKKKEKEKKKHHLIVLLNQKEFCVVFDLWEFQIANLKDCGCSALIKIKSHFSDWYVYTESALILPFIKIYRHSCSISKSLHEGWGRYSDMILSARFELCYSTLWCPLYWGGKSVGSIHGFSVSIWIQKKHIIFLNWTILLLKKKKKKKNCLQQRQQKTPELKNQSKQKIPLTFATHISFIIP